MTPLVSILIPSRKRPKQLLKCVRSFLNSAPWSNLEIRIRMDDDDKPSMDYFHYSIAELNAPVFVQTGPRLKGYASNHLMMTELADASGTPWVWIFNDDATVEGGHWLDKLREFTPENIIIHAEFHQLHQSVYTNDPAGPFPIVPNQCWTKLGLKTLSSPCDTWLWEMAIAHQWRVEFLPGITVSHQRGSEAELKIHRSL